MSEQASREPDSMDILYLLERLEEVLGSGRRLPFFANRTLVDDEECFTIIDQIRLSLPNEIRQARRLNADREELLVDAQARADEIIRTAEANAKERLRDHRITQEAEARGEQIVAQGERHAAQLKREADDYAYRVLEDLDERLDGLAATVRNGLHSLRVSKEAASAREPAEGFDREGV